MLYFSAALKSGCRHHEQIWNLLVVAVCVESGEGVFLRRSRAVARIAKRCKRSRVESLLRGVVGGCWIFLPCYRAVAGIVNRCGGCGGCGVMVVVAVAGSWWLWLWGCGGCGAVCEGWVEKQSWKEPREVLFRNGRFRPLVTVF